MMVMRGLKRSLCMVLGLLLLSLACNAKKLWGVDVGKKEEKGEFASLLQKATSQDSAGGGGVADEAVGTMLAALADADLSSLSLSELCTSAIDAVLEIVKDEEWLGQFAEPGVVGELAQNAGLSAALEDEGMASVERDDLLELLSLESSPILYKTKFYEISEKWIGKLVSLRMDVANPAKLVRMIRDMLQAAGLDEATIAQVMEIVEHPEVLAAQIKEFATNPLLKQQLTSALDGFMSAANAVDDLDLDSEEMMQMLSAMGNEDPEMMEQMLAEMMKDPAFAELMAEEGGAAAGAGGGGGIFKGAGRQGREAEL